MVLPALEIDTGIALAFLTDDVDVSQETFPVTYANAIPPGAYLLVGDPEATYEVFQATYAANGVLGVVRGIDPVNVAATHDTGDGIYLMAISNDFSEERISPTANRLIHFSLAPGDTTGIWLDLTVSGIILKDAETTPHYWRVTIDGATGLIATADLGTDLP